jgi:hypothetical protein
MDLRERGRDVVDWMHGRITLIYIFECEGEEWIQVVLDRVQWRTMVKMVNNFWVP